MLTLEEAKKKADKHLRDIDRCVEYDNAYIFSNKVGRFSIGGGDMPVVVLKESGKVVDITSYYDTMGGKLIKEFDV